MTGKLQFVDGVASSRVDSEVDGIASIHEWNTKVDDKLKHIGHVSISDMQEPMASELDQARLIAERIARRVSEKPSSLHA